MSARDILILRGEEVSSLLRGRELDLIDLIGRAYVTHGRGNSSLPHSSFLLFPHQKRDRIIALPAYLGDQFEVSGIKWIASFPDNINQGIERASAVLILNSMKTGRPEVIMESSLISAQRTAASAALAARTLHGAVAPSCVGFIGCGPINYQIAKFLLAIWPGTRSFKLFDLSPSRANQFGKDCLRLRSELTIEIANSSESVLGACPVVSIATTAAKPHILDLSLCPPQATILHVSLRDISPGPILESANIVDDADHVCQAGTSVHLAEQLVGHRDFITGTLAEVLSGERELNRDQRRPVIFSPFGLGVLDVAVAKFVTTLAVEAKVGTVLESFIPDGAVARL
jgi:N-[(2S)-2-amino-2-carboxyethyl]-L-glutamate dehydrogenase